MLGSTPLIQYRTDYTPGVCREPWRDCADRALQECPPAEAAGAGYLLNIVEFDDQGQLFDRAQLDAVIARISVESAEQDFLAVVFVHGWKHNACEGDKNLTSFRRVLERLCETEGALSLAQGVPARRIIGVYLGWRGLSLSIPVFDNLTFWDRKNTAQKVGHGEVTEVLSRLELIRRNRAAASPTGHTRSRLVVVGHSFGGAVVFTAVAQILESRFLQATGAAGTGPDVTGFCDLVVLINPAFEALLYAPLSDLATERATYGRSQLPLLAVLTSERDWATGLAFPVGRWLSTRFEKEREQTRMNPVSQAREVIDQRQSNIAAVGHFEPYRTHQLTATAQDEEAIGKAPREARVRSVLGAGQSWEDDAPGSRIEFPGSVLERTNNSAGRNPYLVVRVDGKLIPSHDDIWGLRVQAFVGHLILVSGQSSDPTERTRQRLRGLKLSEE